MGIWGIKERGDIGILMYVDVGYRSMRVSEYEGIGIWGYGDMGVLGYRRSRWSG